MLAGAITFALGEQHSMILKEDGSVWSTGDTLRGLSKYFLRIIPKGVKAVAAGTSYSIVLQDDDSVWSTGNNVHGQLGDGTRTSKDTFLFVQV